MSLRLKHLLLVSLFLPFLSSNVLSQTLNSADGEIYLHEYPDPYGTSLPHDPDTFGPYGEGSGFIAASPPDSYNPNAVSADPSVLTKPTPDYFIYERRLAKWKDVLTLPHSRMACVKWAKGKLPFGKSWKTCIGWKTQFQWLHNHADLRIAIRNMTVAQIKEDVNFCLNTGAVAALISAIVTEGAGVTETFVTVTKGCLEAKVSGQLIAVTLPITSKWGGWE